MLGGLPGGWSPLPPEIVQKVLGDPSKYPPQLKSWLFKMLSGERQLQIHMNQLTTTPFLSGVGVPASSLGSNGNFYFRTDTPGVSLQRIYVKSAGAWTGIV